jgi:hypothetical protein
MLEMLGSVGVNGSWCSSQEDLPEQVFADVEDCCFKLGVDIIGYVKCHGPGEEKLQ